MKINWTPLKQWINERQTFVISSHIRPDADAIGSELGLAYLLESMGKSVRIVNASSSPQSLDFLDPDQKLLQLGPQISVAEAAATDGICVVDTSAWGQLQDFAKVMNTSTASRVVIDHHISSDNLAAIEFKDVTSEATGALISQLFREWQIVPPPHIAMALYAAIATDTGWFRFPSTTAETMRTVAWLVDHGAKPDVIYRHLYEQASLARLHLAGRALSRVSLECNGRLAHTYVKYEDFGQLGAQSPDTEDLVNECLKIAGTKAAFIAVELANRNIKISFRSRSAVNVAKVAETFNGGGHALASGATLPPPFDVSHAKVLAAMTAAIEALPEEPAGSIQQ